MSLGTRAKHALRLAAKWERQKIGISAVMPRSIKRGLGQMIRKSLLPEGRRFLPAARLEEFFQTLGQRGTKYVVIRWFESLPHQPDGDIDFLIADDALPEFEALLDRDPAGVPCDLYSESGLPGYSYGGIPYYPPELASGILERRVTVAGWVQAPSAEDHFLSLAYHCVYRKGPDSGLPTSHPSVRPVSIANHDYRGALSSLATKIGLRVNIDMEALDMFLAEQGWRPSHAVLERLAVDNLWIQRQFAEVGGRRSVRTELAGRGVR